MLEFYKKALLGLLALLLTSALVSYWCVERTFLHLALLPAEASGLPWVTELGDDVSRGGASTIKINDEHYSLDFEMTVADQADYPFASLALVFADEAGQRAFVDLSSYTSLSFSVKCSPSNVLTFTAFTIEQNITNPDDFLTYRSPATFFSCNEDWSHVDLDLTRLETPQWWLDMFHLELSMKEYRLDRVPKILFGSTHQGPMGVNARVQLNQLTFHGRDWRYLYLLGVVLFFMWSGYGVWFFRGHTLMLIKELRLKTQKDRPLVAYQHLTIEPQRDREKDIILRFMATEYAHTELNLDVVVTRTGVSRTKINDILKSELGYTFIGYLNKLRLTEAARLLGEKREASIAEVAYSVGYKNVSYFNKLFKEEYGCTPKTFRNLSDKQADDQSI